MIRDALCSTNFIKNIFFLEAIFEYVIPSRSDHYFEELKYKNSLNKMMMKLQSSRIEDFELCVQLVVSIIKKCSRTSGFLQIMSRIFLLNKYSISKMKQMSTKEHVSLDDHCL